VRHHALNPKIQSKIMPKCERCGAFMESAAAACAWCGAGGDNGSAPSFVIPRISLTPDAALAAAGAELNTAGPLAAHGKNLKGISGWLTLAALTLVLAPLSLLFALGTDLLFLMGGRIPTSVSRPAVSGLLFSDAISDLLLLAALIVLNIFFYRTKQIFPRWFITFLAISFIVNFAIQRMIAGYLPTYPTSVAFGSFVSASVWIPYFLRSERVKQTFVN
jgi:hypothetical protein